MKHLMVAFIFVHTAVFAKEGPKYEIGLSIFEVTALISGFDGMLEHFENSAKEDEEWFLNFEKELGVTRAEVDSYNKCLLHAQENDEEFDYEGHLEQGNPHFTGLAVSTINYEREINKLKLESGVKGGFCYSLGHLWTKYFRSGRTPLYIEKKGSVPGALFREGEIWAGGGGWRTRQIIPVEKSPQYPFAIRLAQLIGFCTQIVDSHEPVLKKDKAYNAVKENDVVGLETALREFRDFLTDYKAKNMKPSSAKK